MKKPSKRKPENLVKTNQNDTAKGGPVVGENKLKLSTLRPNDRNPRTIKSEAFLKLCESIKRDPQFMPLRPIVTDGDGCIIAGNQRYMACLHLGMTEVPDSWVIVANGLTEEQRKRFVIIDNSPEGMTGDWDFDILSSDFELPDLEMLGFDRLMREIGKNPVPRDDVVSTDTEKNIIIRISIPAAVYLGKRDEILDMTRKIEKKYLAAVKVEE